MNPIKLVYDKYENDVGFIISDEQGNHEHTKLEGIQDKEMTFYTWGIKKHEPKKCDLVFDATLFSTKISVDVKCLCGKDDIIQLRGDVDVSEEIFGPAKSLVKAEALVRIPATDHNPPGILSFGSRDADMFYPGQGTELLRFLGKSFHKCLIQWQKQKN